MKMLIVGVTGGIATGKSLVTMRFRKLGASTFSADEAARAVLTPGSAVLDEIVSAFGAEMVSSEGQLDRVRLAERIFAGAAARQTLNRIMHPPILRLLGAQIDAVRTDFPPWTVVVVEAPLLFETGMQAWFERIVVVTASEPIQIARLRTRNGVGAQEAKERIAAQWPLDAKVFAASDTLINDGAQSELFDAVDALWKRFTAMASKIAAE